MSFPPFPSLCRSQFRTGHVVISSQWNRTESGVCYSWAQFRAKASPLPLSAYWKNDAFTLHGVTGKKKKTS